MMMRERLLPKVVHVLVEREGMSSVSMCRCVDRVHLHPISLHLWQIRSRQVIAAHFATNTSMSECVSISRGGRIIASGSAALDRSLFILTTSSFRRPYFCLVPASQAPFLVHSFWTHSGHIFCATIARLACPGWIKDNVMWADRVTPATWTHKDLHPLSHSLLSLPRNPCT